MTSDEGQHEGRPFRQSPTGPRIAPKRPATVTAAPPPVQRVTDGYPAAFRWRRLASVIFFAVIVLSAGIRAYRDLSRPDAWSFWKDQYISPSLSSTRVANAGIGGDRTVLAVSGRIGPAAAGWLRDRINEAGLKAGDVVLLSSPGGSLDQGVLMGEIIRAHGLATAVGAVDNGGRIRPGFCASACVFAFAGGQTRYGLDGSALGVHRFTSEAQGDDAVADTQRVTGAILGYVTRMGISSQVIEAMSQTRDIRWLDPREAEAMKLVTAPLKPL
ncbi:hypothetical protein SSBR45G_35600 [Bradyrhizobium sp. SSBR45G]|uniref:COG3904 family protein n=1 Tax=unclassified Bradyrhizobium TaxID=2631580 RepID=UPI00234293E2|nr:MULTISPECIES: hypothetical protein [unclassified Bradyrhizobium]GLH78651.1 hypothetical protein SSBR45G_35600 [Bradyrhizobium sp. SSBR45G]GLH87521.1 hypothetical protein SSBR45R_49810 [Bradyrhizobium sp. SSBR45R]